MITKTKLIILLFTLWGTSIYSQTINSVQFIQKGKFLEISYQLSDLKFNQNAKIDLYVSTNGGLTFIGPLKEVTGDIGKSIDGGNNKILWEVFKEIPDFSGNIVFDVRAESQLKKIKKQLYVGYTGALETPIGVTVGVLGNWGFYVTSRLSADYFKEVLYETDGESVLGYDELGYYNFNGNTAYQRLSITAGINKQISKSLHIYVGGGYSEYALLWQLDQYDYNNTKYGNAYAEHTTESFSSYELEAGLKMQFSKLIISAGVSTPAFNWFEFVGAVGYVF